MGTTTCRRSRRRVLGSPGDLVVMVVGRSVGSVCWCARFEVLGSSMPIHVCVGIDVRL